MSYVPTPEEALEILKKYNQEEFHMRPSKSVSDMELKSLKKKFKDKRFAAGCSRDVIRTGAEMLGWDLDQLLEGTLTAMKELAPELGL